MKPAIPAAPLRWMFLWLLYASAYTGMSLWMRQNGYFSWEGLFISQKLELMFLPGIDKLKLFLFVYPSFSFFAALPGVVVSFLEAPYLISILFVSLFSASIVHTMMNNRSAGIVWTTALYLLLSPVFLFAAASGTSFYGYFIGYYLVFLYLFRYVDDLTTYRLTMLGLVLMLMIFVNYRILWLFVFLIPLVFVLTIRSASQQRLSVPSALERIYTTATLRRKFLGRAYAMMVVVGFLPMVSFALYLVLNFILTGDTFFFEENVSSQWSSYVKQRFVSFESLGDKRLASTNDPYFYGLLALLAPMYLYQWIRHARQFFKISIFLTIPLLLLYFFRADHFELINLNYFSVFLACGLAAGVIYKPRERYLRLNQAIWPLILVVSLVGEWYYFSQSSYTPEKAFYQQVRHQEPDELLIAMQEAAAFLDEALEPEERVLCDEAIFYPLMAFSDDQQRYLHTFGKYYYAALQNPSVYADYLVFSTARSPFYNWDAIRFYEQEFNRGKGYTLTFVYSNRYLLVARILREDRKRPPAPRLQNR